MPGRADPDLPFSGTIEGTATLRGTGEPVAGAEARGLYDLGPVAAVTDANGYYQLDGLSERLCDAGQMAAFLHRALG